jgi:2-polyprenyl-6-hydroxyphenyl methylase/3-demethylubiquinone-9 3-methyltransferase
MIAGTYFTISTVLRTLKNLAVRRRFRRDIQRGMSAWHDAIDWVGGYPFEVATREEVIAYYEARGFLTEKVIGVGKKQGCNQFVFRLCPKN